MKIVNATPHEIVFITKDGRKAVFPPSSLSVRVETSQTPVIEDQDFLFEVEKGNVSGLPTETDDTVYIVSTLVLEAADRGDLIAPLGLIRDDKGRVIGNSSFSVSPFMFTEKAERILKALMEALS